MDEHHHIVVLTNDPGFFGPLHCFTVRLVGAGIQFRIKFHLASISQIDDACVIVSTTDEK